MIKELIVVKLLMKSINTLVLREYEIPRQNALSEELFHIS